MRRRLLGIINDPVPSDHSWGKSGFIGVHVRLGDFAVGKDNKQVTGNQNNIRIPLSWYVNILRALKERHPQMPIRVFSDGREEELQELTSLGATLYRSGSDITDLLAMASASILVGSNSTYSRWAVFLGNMPSIWLEKQTPDEKPSAAETPILHIPLDMKYPALWPQDF